MSPPKPSADADTAARVVELPIESIAPGTSQARRYFDEAALEELAASISASGVIQPVVVRGDARTGYRLLAGERRWRAAQRARLAQLPAIVRNDLDDAEAAVLGLIENLQRESLGVMDTAEGLARLIDEHGLTHDTAARRIGKSRAYVSNYLRLRGLGPAAREAVEQGRLQMGHARVLAGVDAARQQALVARAIARRMSVRALEKAARDGDRSNARPTRDPALAALESQLTDQLGNAVHIDYDADRRRGELRIAFHDLDEFDGLLARLGYEA